MSLIIPTNDPITPVMAVPLNGSGVASFSLTLTMAGTSSGTVSSSPAGSPPLNCVNGTCTAIYQSGSVIVLTANPNDWMAPGLFTGDCAGSVSCSVIMSADRNVIAAFDIVNKVQVTAGTPLDHPGIQSAYNAVITGAHIKAQNYLFPENLLFNLPKNVTLTGGWNGAYSTNTGSSIIQGSMIIRSGSVRARNIIIR